MRYSKTKSEQTRRSVLDAAAIRFREEGFAGVGVNAIASAAEVTSGAIYSQFGSKGALFDEIVDEGMQRFISGLERFKERGDKDWLAQFIAYYLGTEHVGNVGGGCGLPTLSVDVARAGEGAQAVYMERILDAVNIVSDDDRDRRATLLLLASLLGGVILARATNDEHVREDLLAAVSDLVKGS